MDALNLREGKASIGQLISIRHESQVHFLFDKVIDELSLEFLDHMITVTHQLLGNIETGCLAFFHELCLGFSADPHQVLS